MQSGGHHLPPLVEQVLPPVPVPPPVPPPESVQLGQVSVEYEGVLSTQSVRASFTLQETIVPEQSIWHRVADALEFVLGSIVSFWTQYSHANNGTAPNSITTDPTISKTRFTIALSFFIFRPN
jgi:hypothetical protein